MLDLHVHLHVLLCVTLVRDMMLWSGVVYSVCLCVSALQFGMLQQFWLESQAIRNNDCHLSTCFYTNPTGFMLAFPDKEGRY